MCGWVGKRQKVIHVYFDPIHIPVSHVDRLLN